MKKYNNQTLRIDDDNALILVEGINGAGKSTFVEYLVNNLPSSQRIITHRGTGIHPVDLLRVALYSPYEYEEMLRECERLLPAEDYDKVMGRLRQYTVEERGMLLLPYLKVYEGCPAAAELCTKARRKELYDGNSTFAVYSEWIGSRWADFPRLAEAKWPQCKHVFEAVTFQYPIMELLGFYQMSPREIIAYIDSLIEKVAPMNPVLFYMEVPSVEAAIDCAARSRVRWLKRYGEWLSTTPYARSHCLSGIDGIVRFCEARYDIEHEILEHISIKKTIIYRTDLT